MPTYDPTTSKKSTHTPHTHTKKKKRKKVGQKKRLQNADKPVEIHEMHTALNGQI